MDYKLFSLFLIFIKPVPRLLPFIDHLEVSNCWFVNHIDFSNAIFSFYSWFNMNSLFSLHYRANNTTRNAHASRLCMIDDTNVLSYKQGNEMRFTRFNVVSPLHCFIWINLLFR